MIIFIYTYIYILLLYTYYSIVIVFYSICIVFYNIFKCFKYFIVFLSVLKHFSQNSIKKQCKTLKMVNCSIYKINQGLVTRAQAETTSHTAVDSHFPSMGTSPAVVRGPRVGPPGTSPVQRKKRNKK